MTEMSERPWQFSIGRTLAYSWLPDIDAIITRSTRQAPAWELEDLLRCGISLISWAKQASALSENRPVRLSYQGLFRGFRLVNSV
jgi:hypothetical protein